MAAPDGRGPVIVYLRLFLVLVLGTVAYYNRRDLFMHWIRRDQPKNRVCVHACCLGMRAHPYRYPVNRRRHFLRSASDEQLLGLLLAAW